MKEVCDGHGWTSTEAVSRPGVREVFDGRSQEGWHGRKNGTQISHAGCVAKHAEAATHLSDTEGPAGGPVAQGPRTAGSGAAPARQDAVRLAPQGVSRAAVAEPAPHLGAARPALAGHGG